MMDTLAHGTRSRAEIDLAIADGRPFLRKFWHNCLPRLKYHNPAVPMTINRTDDQEGPALMTIHFTTASEAANTKPPISTTASQELSVAPVAPPTREAQTERIVQINMKHRHESEILSALMAATKAKALEPTAEEKELMRTLEEARKLSETDSKRSKAVNEKRRAQEAVLAQARGELAAARAE